jgi:hypothetical protein
MPLWAWVLVVVAVLLAVMWNWDRRTKARRARLADPAVMARGVRAPEGNAEAHRGAMRPDRFDAGIGPNGW